VPLQLVVEDGVKAMLEETSDKPKGGKR